VAAKDDADRWLTRSIKGITMKYLITGGCGFLGSNIASEILKQGHELIVFDNLYRIGSELNQQWLREQGTFLFIHGDIRNYNDVERAVRQHKPDVIYHLAGQVAMTTSIADPRMDFEVNALGSFNVLDSVRQYSPDTTVIYSSTNKVYGDLEQFSYQETETRYVCKEHPDGFDESINLDFHSPYGTSKGSADQYMLDFARIYGLKTVVFRHSSMFGGRQFATYDQGWIGWFCQQAIEIKQGLLKDPFTISGNGKQVRDLLYASDTVALYLKASEKIDTIKGQAFNVGGGIKNSSSLLELFSFLEKELNIEMKYIKLPVRESDQKVFVSDIGKVTQLIDWNPKISKEEGVRKMLKWVEEI
jgi:CDP-paratose 2-epimerase